MVGSLFDGAGKEGEDGSDPDGVAAEERVAGTGGEGGEEEGEREAEEEVVELVWSPPGVFAVVGHFGLVFVYGCYNLDSWIIVNLGLAQGWAHWTAIIKAGSQQTFWFGPLYLSTLLIYYLMLIG